MFHELFGGKKPVIGMIHLGALPGSPGYKENWKKLLEKALQDADALVEGGVNGIQVENQFDKPFLKMDEIGPETTAFLTAAGCMLKKEYPDIPLGINIHLNGAVQAMAAAKAAGADWIRAFNLANGYISNSGYVDALGAKLLRYRCTIDAENIMIFADFQVKHGSHAITADRTFEEKARDVETAMADAAIITGNCTGKAPDSKAVREVKNSIHIPLLIGSGVNSDNVNLLWKEADGAIIGSAFKKNGDLSQPVNRELVKTFMEKIQE